MLLFAFAVSVVTGIGFGVAPAWLASHADPMEAMRGASRSTARKTSFPRKALVVVQAALSLVLLSAAAMLSQSLHNLEYQHLGFATQDRFVAGSILDWPAISPRNFPTSTGAFRSASRAFPACAESASPPMRDERR